MRKYFLPLMLTMSLFNIALAQNSIRSNTLPQVAGSGDSNTHFNTQVRKLNGEGLVFAAAYSTALTEPNAPTNYPGWIDGKLQSQIDRDYFEFDKRVIDPVHDVVNDGAEFRWLDDYQAGPNPERGSDGGQIRPSVKGLIRKGKLDEVVSEGELWFQYEVWFEKGRAEFGKAHGWTSQKTARVEDGTVRPNKQKHWTVTLRFNHRDNKALWMLRGFAKEVEPTFAKKLTEGAWQRITVRTYDIGTPAPKVDAWHQDEAQKKADQIFKAVPSNWNKETVVGGIALMNSSSGHGGKPFPDHDFSVLFRNWIVSKRPISLGEDSIGN